MKKEKKGKMLESWAHHPRVMVGNGIDEVIYNITTREACPFLESLHILKLDDVYLCLMKSNTPFERLSKLRQSSQTLSTTAHTKSNVF